MKMFGSRSPLSSLDSEIQKKKKKKNFPYNLSHISYKDETWHILFLPKEHPKTI